MEDKNNIERSDLWSDIHSIVKQIPRKEVSGDAMDARSAATEIEELLMKRLKESKPMGSLLDELPPSDYQIGN